MPPCDCAPRCACQVVAGPGITVSGNGSSGTPYVISGSGGSGVVTCDQVRPCISAGPGATYDPATGVVAADVSGDAGNTLVVGADGGLYAPGADCADVRACLSAGTGLTYDVTTGQFAAVPAPAPTVACGLTGDGTSGAPLAAAVSAWPYPCDADTLAGRVYCDSTGTLRAEPRGRTSYASAGENVDYPATAVPTVASQVIATHTLDVVNPDPCRSAFVIMNADLDIDFNLPPHSSAAYGFNNDELANVQNQGDTLAQDVHVELSQMWRITVPAGGTVSEPMTITMGRGTGGATYNRIQWSIRSYAFIL